MAVSEPNSAIVIIKKYRKFGDTAELRQLTRDVIRWECRPYLTMKPQPLGYIVKFSSMGTVLLPLFRYNTTIAVFIALHFSTFNDFFTLDLSSSSVN